MSVAHKGFVDGRAREQEITRIVLADSDTDMVCLNSSKKLSPPSVFLKAFLDIFVCQIMVLVPLV